MVIMLCSLFETHKISQEDKYESNGLPPFRQLKIYFEDTFSECTENHFAAASIEMNTVLYGPPGRTIKPLEPTPDASKQNTISSSNQNTRRGVQFPQVVVVEKPAPQITIAPNQKCKPLSNLLSPASTSAHGGTLMSDVAEKKHSFIQHVSDLLKEHFCQGQKGASNAIHHQ